MGVLLHCYAAACIFAALQIPILKHGLQTTRGQMAVNVTELTTNPSRLEDINEKLFGKSLALHGLGLFCFRKVLGFHVRKVKPWLHDLAQIQMRPHGSPQFFSWAILPGDRLHQKLFGDSALLLLQHRQDFILAGKALPIADFQSGAENLFEIGEGFALFLDPDGIPVVGQRLTVKIRLGSPDHFLEIGIRHDVML